MAGVPDPATTQATFCATLVDEWVRAGVGQAIGPIVGAVMREMKGRADGGEVTRLIRSKLGL